MKGLGAVLLAGCAGGMAGPAGETRQVPILLPYDGGEAIDEVHDHDAGVVVAPVPDAGTPALPAFANATFEVPDSGTPQGMSCAWLDAPDNCWKAALASVASCLGDAGVGRLVDPYRCELGNGAKWGSSQAAGLTDGGTAGWTTAIQLTGPGGQQCLATAYAFAKQRLETPLGTLYFRSTSLLEYELTCADGTVHTNVADAGTCDSFGLRFLFGGVPGLDAQCSDTECWGRATGTSTGVARVATCGR